MTWIIGRAILASLSMLWLNSITNSAFPYLLFFSYKELVTFLAKIDRVPDALCRFLCRCPPSCRFLCRSVHFKLVVCTVTLMPICGVHTGIQLFHCGWYLHCLHPYMFSDREDYIYPPWPSTTNIMLCWLICYVFNIGWFVIFFVLSAFTGKRQHIPL